MSTIAFFVRGKHRSDQEVVEYAHAHDVTVEGDLAFSRRGDEDSAEHRTTPSPPREEFVANTGDDSLAISIGTSHGAFKFKPEQCTLMPTAFRSPNCVPTSSNSRKAHPGFPDRPARIEARASAVRERSTSTRKMEAAVGIPAEPLRRAASPHLQDQQRPTTPRVHVP
jgi:fructose-bisphosphate aldolase class II